MIRCAVIISLLLGSTGYVPKNNIALDIIIYNLNNQKLWTYALNMTSLSVTRHFLAGEADRLVHQRALTLREIKRLDRFLARYPFAALERYYINEKISGTSGTVYCITINRDGKEVFVYYARPAAVLELNRFINRLLPRQYHLWDEGL